MFLAPCGKCGLIGCDLVMCGDVADVCDEERLGLTGGRGDFGCIYHGTGVKG